MPTVRLSSQVMQKTLSGGGRDFGVPARWLQTTYAPGWPIQPLSPPRDSKIPRGVDYPLSVNTMIQPRSGWGHMDFASLYSVYDNVAEVKMQVNMVHRQLTSFIASLVDSDHNPIPNHPMDWMTKSPDGRTPFNVWLTRLIKSTKVYDAAAVYLEQDNDNQITGLHYIDGSTLFVIVDESGNTPRQEKIMDYVKRVKAGLPGPQNPVYQQLAKNGTSGPKTIDEFIQRILNRVRDGLDVPTSIPAYTQVIKGTPFTWWSEDQIWYMPQSRRMNSPYGDSFIEDAWIWIMIIVNLAAFELGHYRTGNMPEGFATLPRDLFENPDKILKFEEAYNARMSSNPETERNRLRFFPDGTHWTQTKKADWPDRLYDRCWKIIGHTIGNPASEFGDMPGGGLGGKGFKEGSASELGRNVLNPHRAFFMDFFNEILARNGVDDATFDLGYSREEVDPDKLRQGVYDGMSHGLLTLNDGLGELNQDPVEGSMMTVEDSRGNQAQVPDPKHIANQHLIVAGAAIYVMEEMQTQGGMAVPKFTGQPGGNTGGTPAGPETAVEQSGSEHTPEDHKTVEKALRNLIETGKLTATTYSIPAQVGKAKPKPPEEKPADPPADLVVELQPGDPDVNLTEHVLVSNVVKPFEGHAQMDGIAQTREQHEEELLAPKPNPFVLDERLDHISVPVANVNEPRVEKLEKHCGVCPEDDEYFGAPISREVQLDWPDEHHANNVEIVAMCPPGLPPHAALWKPEGGEMDSLQGWVGGPQYVREEAMYLLDRCLGFMLVPVAYVAEANDEIGAAIYYTAGGEQGRDPSTYDPQWVERAAVEDYIASQVDRASPGHNVITHPDDSGRMILIDNGLAFPADEDLYCTSQFCNAYANRPLSSETLKAIQRCLMDTATWRDILALVGPAATRKAMACAQRLLDEKMITAYSGSSS